MTVKLPSTNDETLRRYLLSAAGTIRDQLAAGLAGDAEARLTETAAVITRVAQQIVRRNATEGDAREEFAAVLAAEREFLSQTAGKASEQPSVGARSIDAERIEAFLRGHALGGRDVKVASARLLAGGRCKITGLIKLEGARALPQTIVLRQDWDGGATATTVAGEFALLERLFDRGVRVPKPLLLERDSGALGSPFIMVEQMPGRVEGGLYNPPASRALLLQMAEQLGRIHTIPLADVEPLLASIPYQTATDAAEIEGFADLHAQYGLRSSVIDASIDWLRANIALAGNSLSLVHNDFGFHNCLVDEDRLTAVLDWELSCIGHPASDLGYIKHFVDKVLPWDEFIDHYVASGGARIDPETIRYHAVWNAVRLYGLIMVARHNLELGRVTDMEITYACADNVMLLIAFLGGEIFGKQPWSRAI